MLPCGICGDEVPYVRDCDLVHVGVCHSCYQYNFSPSLESAPHPAPTYEAQRAAYMAAMEAYHARFGEAYDQTLRQLLGPGEDT